MLFSIIVPIYNAEVHIESCLNTIFNQTFKDFELLLVDDGSTDNSLNICKKFASENANIKLFSKENGGVSSARNCGIKEAKGQYILFLDSDDGYLPKSLEILSSQVRRDEMIIFNYCIENETEEVIKKKSFDVMGKKNIGSLVDNFWEYSAGGLINSPWNKVYNREVILKNRILFPERIRMGEDLIFNLKYFECVKKFNILPNVLYKYRIHGNQATVKTDYGISFDMITYLKKIDQLFSKYLEKNSRQYVLQNREKFLHLLTAIKMAYRENNMSKKDRVNYIKEVCELFDKELDVKKFLAKNSIDQTILFLIKRKKYTLLDKILFFGKKINNYLR